jgi:hypothetical protein
VQQQQQNALDSTIVISNQRLTLGKRIGKAAQVDLNTDNDLLRQKNYIQIPRHY